MPALVAALAVLVATLAAVPPDHLWDVVSAVVVVVLALPLPLAVAIRRGPRR